MNTLLIEPLSERELDVLRLLATDLDGPGIARELVVSLSTVRTHTRSIYAKLGVNNRRAAVRRADELQLLGATSHTPAHQSSHVTRRAHHLPFYLVIKRACDHGRPAWFALHGLLSKVRDVGLPLIARHAG